MLKHKKEVFVAMAQCGHPIRGLFHDMSKFSFTEFSEGVKYFQGNRSPIEACKEDIGYSKAWFRHRGRNKHHSQYWVDISWGKIIPCEIPWKYLVEFLCDGVGAGKVYLGSKWNNSSPLNYWIEKDGRSFYHINTRIKIEIYYRLIDAYGWEWVSSCIKHFGDIVELNQVSVSEDDMEFLSSVLKDAVDSKCVDCNISFRESKIKFRILV